MFNRLRSSCGCGGLQLLDNETSLLSALAVLELNLQVLLPVVVENINDALSILLARGLQVANDRLDKVAETACRTLHTCIGIGEILLQGGIVTTTRKTRGDDIDAACGQLAGQVQDKTRRRLERIIPVQESSE